MTTLELTGPDAFYKKDDYVESTYRDFQSKEFVEPIYTFNTSNKVISVAKDVILVLATIVLSLAIYKSSLGKKKKIFLVVLAVSTASIYKIFTIGIRYFVLPVSMNKILCDYRPGDTLSYFLGKQWLAENPFKCKKVSIKVNDKLVDATIIGKDSTFHNGRWVAMSLGNGSYYENYLQEMPSSDSLLSDLLSNDMNAILYNYPGVGKSECGAILPSPQEMVDAHKAVLNFLEDETMGMNAKQILVYGYSIGGGVIGETCKTHELKPNIQYLFITDRSFSDFSSAGFYVVKEREGDFLAHLAKFWVKITDNNLDSTLSTEKIKAKHIVVQTTSLPECKILTEEDVDAVIHDGTMPKEATLAYRLLQDRILEDRIFVGIPELHYESLEKSSRKMLMDKVKEILPFTDF